jgi:hypothetical protein
VGGSVIPENLRDAPAQAERWRRKETRAVSGEFKGARHSLKGELFPLYDPKPSELTISRVKGADWRLKARTVECDKILR